MQQIEELWRVIAVQQLQDPIVFIFWEDSKKSNEMGDWMMEAMSPKSRVQGTTLRNYGI